MLTPVAEIDTIMILVIVQFYSKLDELKDVVLRGMLIYGTDMSHDLSTLVPSIRDLDISRSLIPNWQRVADITKQLKNLKSLNVR